LMMLFLSPRHRFVFLLTPPQPIFFLLPEAKFSRCRGVPPSLLLLPFYFFTSKLFCIPFPPVPLQSRWSPSLGKGDCDFRCSDEKRSRPQIFSISGKPHFLFLLVFTTVYDHPLLLNFLEIIGSDSENGCPPFVDSLSSPASILLSPLVRVCPI